MVSYEKELKKYLSNKDNIILAYLFGSTVRGDTGILSDIDIGVLLDENISNKDRFDVELKIISEIAILINKNKIDIVVLNEAPLLLSYNIIKTGVILKSNEPERIKFETRILDEYLDQKYYINRHSYDSLKRIAQVGFS